MNKYGVGDLVWVPAGTKTRRAHPRGQLHSSPTTKPHWGLVVEVDKLEPIWLSLKINNIVHRVDQNHVRKIDSKELIYDKISRSSTNV